MEQKVEQSDDLITEQKTAALLGTSCRMLTNWRCIKPEKLPFVKVGRLVRYRRADIEAFIKSNTHGGAQ